MGKYNFDPKTGQRIWIASVTNPTTSLYSTLVGDSSRNTCDNASSFPSPQGTESQYSDYQQAPTQHHPLNLKWILTQRGVKC